MSFDVAERAGRIFVDATVLTVSATDYPPIAGLFQFIRDNAPAGIRIVDFDHATQIETSTNNYISESHLRQIAGLDEMCKTPRCRMGGGEDVQRPHGMAIYLIPVAQTLIPICAL